MLSFSSLYVFFCLVCIGKKKIEYFLGRFLKVHVNDYVFEKKLTNFKKLLYAFDDSDYFLIEIEKKNNGYKHNFEIGNKLGLTEKFLLDTNTPQQKSKKEVIKSPRKTNKLCQIENDEASKEAANKSKNSVNFSLFTFVKIRNRCLFIIFCVVVFISEQLYNTFTDKGFFDDIVLAKRLSYYYLDRNPSYNEILLYHRMSILINEPNMLTIRVM